MKITIITPTFPYPKRGIFPGFERYMEFLVLYLKKEGQDVQIITTFWNGGKRHDKYKGIPILRIKESKSLIGKLGSIFFFNYISFGFSLLKKKNFKYIKGTDIVLSSFATLFTFLFKRKNIPFISIFLHYDKVKSIGDYLTIPFLHILQRIQYEKHKDIITISPSSKNDLIKYYGLHENNITVIPIGIDTEKFNLRNYSKDIREKYGENILFYSGLMIYRKRIPVLLKAMKYIVKKIPNTHLILAGDGPMLNYLKKLAKSYGLHKKTTFLGFIDEKELLKYYATSDLYIFPSELEGFGQVILEAMASGTPVICVNKPPMSEIIENGGLPFKLNDPKDLSKKIIELLNNEEKLEILRTNALKIAEKYRWKKITKKYIDYIMSIIKKKK